MREDAGRSEHDAGVETGSKGVASSKAAEPSSGPSGPSGSSAREGKSPSSPRQRRIGWGWILGVALVVEFWAYGHNGHIEVCVGKPDVHDFELVGTERTDDNRWRFPRCDRRANLGLRGGYQARVDEAVRVACRGATTLQHRGETKPCVEARDGWTHRIDARQCPPWHGHFWGHLLWFLP